MRNMYLVLKQLKHYVLLPFFLGIGLIAFAQNKIISGHITDSTDGSGISNVSVVANGTALGTQTDARGNRCRSFFASPTNVFTFSLLNPNLFEI